MRHILYSLSVNDESKFLFVKKRIFRNANMPGTGAERTRKYIEKLKSEGKYDDLKRKKAEAEKSRRERVKEALNKMPGCKRKQFVDNARSKCLERVRKFRQKAKPSNLAPSPETSNSEDTGLLNAVPTKQHSLQRECVQSSYKTEGALAKATTKFRKGLPKSPSRQAAVITKFFNHLDNDIRQKVLFNKTKPNKGGKKGIDPKLLEEIKLFYERDDVSRMSSNTKDSRFYRNRTTGQRELKQKRYLLLTLEQAYDKFVIENGEKYPDTPVKLSKFCSSRPAHVQLVNSTPKNVCLCIYHENFIQCCTVLHKYVPQFPEYGPELKRVFTCNDESVDCWFKCCAHCGPQVVEKKLRVLTKGYEKKTIKWWQWEKDETTNRTEKKTKTGTVKKLLDYLLNVYQAFLKHSFTNRKQSRSFNDDLKNVDLNKAECLIQCDFAENWTNECQDEVTNAHWNQKQISLFTISLRYFGKQHSKVIASDNLDHSKDTIFAYLYKILSKIPKSIKRVKIWSDGPSNQFKNKYMAAVMKVFETKFRKKIIWNYHATAHGKSCVDGIGAVVKSKIKRMVSARKTVVNCAKEFVCSFKEERSKVEIIEMSNVEINKINTAMRLENIVQSAVNIKDISKFHQIQCVNNDIKGFLFSEDGYKSLK